MNESNVSRLMEKLGREYQPARPPYQTEAEQDGPPPRPRPKSHALGADWVAILLTVAWLTDQAEQRGEPTLYWSAEQISRYAGQSRSTITGKLPKIEKSGWLDVQTRGRRKSYALDV